MSSEWILFVVLTVAGMFLSMYKRKLTVAGGFSGGFIAFLIFAGSGSAGFISMALFFIMATLATSYKRTEKSPSTHHQTRNAIQVWANAGVAAMAGALSLVFSHDEIYRLIIAAVFSSAAADTLSSEMGMVKGRRFFNIITLKPDKKGLDGVVSVEGYLWGFAASLVIAAIHYLAYHSIPGFCIVIISGTVGNTCDSVMGALWERKGKMGNDLVNFLNTLVAAITATAAGLLIN